MTQLRAIKDWKQSYDPALKVARGDQLLVVKEDKSKWAGWVWCTDTNGLSGWLPVQVFDALEIGKTNTATEKFNTIELTISAGEILFVSNSLNDWSWCRNEQGKEGWVPDDCLTHVIDAA